MFLGALLDAGFDMKALKRELSKLSLKGYSLSSRKVKRGEIISTKFDVILGNGSHYKRRTLRDILNLIQKSRLSDDAKEKSCDIFKSLAVAESKIHKESIKNLHFHEIGDTDSIIDIVGVITALKILKIDKVYASRINIGDGDIIKTEGGVLPLPAPAALYLLKGIPIYHTSIKAELVTPTGAALLKGLVDRFDYLPDITIKNIGYGAGAKEFAERPNCLRVMIGESVKDFAEDNIYVIEANIDDMMPVDYEHLMERLFKEGALDVYLVPVQMKKTRPGIVLTILAERDDLDKLSSIVFNESTTIGIRYYPAERKKLARRVVRVNTRYGNIRVKVSTGPNGIKKVVPEYDDCKRIADSKDIPLAQVRRETEKVLSRL